MTRCVSIGVLAALAVTMAGCSGPTAAPAAKASAAAPSSYPVSLNAIMVGAVDHASDPLFAVGNALAGTGKPPASDDDWREVEYHAYQMIVLGKAIQIPGTGPKDAEWTANPQWRAFGDSLTSIGVQMQAKAQVKDVAAFEQLGNQLLDVCEACHKAFKPELPTMGILHKPDFPPAGK